MRYRANVNSYIQFLTAFEYAGRTKETNIHVGVASCGFLTKQTHTSQTEKKLFCLKTFLKNTNKLNT